VGQSSERIDDALRDFIASQPLFFVGTAPLHAHGHVNVSPKGPIGSLRFVDDRTVAYLDVIGSGAETIAHVRENGRIVIMVCAFEGPPRIVRLHGLGEIVMRGSKRYDALLARCAFEDPGLPESRRAIVVVHLTRVATSCGYGVPLMNYAGQRSQLADWTDAKLRSGGEQALEEYKRRNNEMSIDGLPAIDLAEDAE
jgi:hypothetical protein